ncbi:ShlB/FhaC/HecB family hemolysin secretion/activation protein [Paraherbaspirillum soli]|uniref:ShlB/FhaC/HecB family hemolysin secretion/activation protein n=1 Tax=Paraherbaspirillum soli TaxID=631222 RepID=A0ABW0MA98_9BURK
MRKEIVLGLLLGGALHGAAAQTVQTPASEEQRRRNQAEAEQRQRQQQEPNVDLQGQAPAAAEADTLTLPAETPCFTLQQFVLEVPSQLPARNRAAGASDLPLDPFRFAQDYLRQYAGQCVGREGINLIVKRLTNRMLAKGYTTTRLGIPEQDLATGTLILTLVPGVIRAIRFADPGLVGTWKTAFPASPGDLLNLRDLEQGLEQMKRVASQEVDMQIVPGEVPGESDVVIDVKRSKPWTLTVNLDDSGAKGTGKLQSGVKLAVDNPLGLNDQFNLGLNTDADRKGDQRGTTGNSIYYAIPYGYSTFALSASSYDYHQTVAAPNQSVVSSGKSKNLEFNLQHLFYRDQTQKDSWQFKLGKRWSRAFIEDTEIGNNALNTTSAELAWVHKHYLGAAQLDLTLANRWGVSWFNGQGDQPGSAATHRYTLQTIDATLTVPFKLAEQALTYSGTLHGQTSRSQLYLADQISIGSRYTVRGFDGELTLAGERGFFMRNELDLPLAGSAQSAYAGIDFGKVVGHAPGDHEQLGDKLAGATLGMRGGALGMTYDLFASWALYKPQHFGTQTPAVGFSLSYQY